MKRRTKRSESNSMEKYRKKAPLWWKIIAFFRGYRIEDYYEF